jgi:hypothetical protein
MLRGPFKGERQKDRVEGTASKDTPFHPLSPRSVPAPEPYTTSHMSLTPRKTCAITTAQQAIALVN